MKPNRSTLLYMSRQSPFSEREEKENNRQQSAASLNDSTLFKVPKLENMILDALDPEKLNELISCDPNSALGHQFRLSAELQENLWEIYQQKIINHFLQLVMQGEQDRAEQMVALNPDLILPRGHSIDYSSRKFVGNHAVSAWEYALWAHDSHMYRMLCKYIPENQKPQALQQLNDLERRGVTYTISEKVTNPGTQEEEIREKTITESHYDFSPLINALQTCVNNFSAWNYEQRFEHWVKKVGAAQRMVPVHVANEYCYRNRSFDPIPQFDENNFKLLRTLQFYNYISYSDSAWFPLSSSDSTGLGFDFAINRGSSSHAEGRLPDSWLVMASGFLDLASITALRKARQSELIQLKQQLQNLAPNHDTRPPKCLIV